MSFLDRFLNKEQDVEVNSSEEQPVTTAAPAQDFSIPLSEDTRKVLQDQITERLRGIFDPEIPVNIYDMGLIYEINVAEDANVEIIMTLTTPNCPVAESMPGDVQLQAGDVDGVRDVNVDLVWDPPWSIYMMSEATRLEMGFM